MPTVAQHYGLGKNQPELDFVNVELLGDTRLFVDPFALSQRLDHLSAKSHDNVRIYFQGLVDSIRAKDSTRSNRLLSNLNEPNETRLGYSLNEPKGAGIGINQSQELFRALRGSTAVTTGFIENLEEAELLIPGISRDKISDMTTNIIMEHLVTYTQQQAALFNIPIQNVPFRPVFDGGHQVWRSNYVDLPVAYGLPLILVPKIFVRLQPNYNYQKYYKSFVLDYLQAEHLSANTSLVETLKNGVRRVTKKSLQNDPRYRLSKEFLFFSQKRTQKY